MALPKLPVLGVKGGLGERTTVLQAPVGDMGEIETVLLSLKRGKQSTQQLRDLLKGAAVK